MNQTRIVIALTVMLLHGCAWHEPNFRLYDEGAIEASQAVLLTTEADASTFDKLEQSFGFPLSRPLLMGINAHKPDTANNGYNSMYDGKFEVKVLPGKTELWLKPYLSTVNNKPYKVVISAESGHTYLISEVRSEGGVFQIFDKDWFNWLPVVYDLTEKRLIYPSEATLIKHKRSK